MFIYGAGVFMMLSCAAPGLPLDRPGPESLESVTRVTSAAQTRAAVGPFGASRQAGSSE